jgi:cellulose synthase (UDP-forming)
VRSPILHHSSHPAIAQKLIDVSDHKLLMRIFYGPHSATRLLLLSSIILAGLITLGRLIQSAQVSQLWQAFEQMQTHPPMWAMVPAMMGQYLLYWTVLLLAVVQIIIRISPRPRNWSRFIVVSILLVLAGRYLLWRSVATLNLSSPITSVVSLGVFALEMLLFIGTIIQLLLLLLPSKDRRAEADRHSIAVINGDYNPPIAILIPTYNEPAFVLQRTIIGCQALEYDGQVKIYLLDDSQRSEVAELAKSLGCDYIARSENRHAKAGNLNHAIPMIIGELIVVFDADFIPIKNFLTRTVGFFQNPKIALVQTPQTFYNADPIARNLGLEDILTPEEEVFYRQIQPARDAAGGVICSGTSFIVRRSALVESGCFFTGSLSEDYFTGIRLAAKGYDLVYLNEKLSAGLAAENIASQALQRLRWAQGTLQAFFVSANPLTIAGLNPLQRLAHAEGLLHWFSSLAQIGFLLIPPAYAFLGIIPIRATPEEMFYFFIPYYLVSLTTAAWLNSRSRSAMLSSIYSLVLAFPLASTVVKVMFDPFGKGFQVTPKGTVNSKFTFNWLLALPLFLMFFLTAFSLWINLSNYLMMGEWHIDMPLEILSKFRGIGIGWIWSAYNLLLLAVSLLILVDAPRLSSYDWYDLNYTIAIEVGKTKLWGTSTALSETGIEIQLTHAPPQALLQSVPVVIHVLETGLSVVGTIEEVQQQSIQIRFEPLDLAQQRQLVEMIYCRPGQWQHRCSPGELQSIGLLLKTLLQPKILFDRKHRITPIRVAKI